jgi:hypothetical protein
MRENKFFKSALVILAVTALVVAGFRGFASADTYAGTCSYNTTTKIFSCYDPLLIEPQTIPLWGPSWRETTVTYRIEQSRGVTPQAIVAVERAIAGWNAAIATLNGAPATFLVPPSAGERAEIVIRPKSGGGSVQGQALASTDAQGFFSGCKVNVSGKAFGSTNDTATVESIALQEIGHCLGLLHSDNERDVMFGYVQTPANTWISQCDLAAFAAVGNGTGTLPAAGTEVTCGTASGGQAGDPATVTLSGINGTYNDRDTVNVTVHVEDSSHTAVGGAAVTIRITTPKGFIYQGNGSSNNNGDFSAPFTINARRDGFGTYTVNAEACKGTVCKQGAESFEVVR